LSDAFEDHIPHIHPDNPLLLDSIEHGPIVITKATPTPAEGQSAYTIDVMIPRKKFYKQLVVDASKMFIANVSSRKVIGFPEGEFITHLHNFPLTIKYMQFLHPIKFSERRKRSSSSIDTTGEKTFRATEPPVSRPAVQSTPPRSEKKSLLGRMWSRVRSIFQK